MLSDLEDKDITFLKGIGPNRARLLAEHLKVRTYADLLRLYPASYVDRSKTYAISSFTQTDAPELPLLQLRGRFVSFTLQGEGAKQRLVGLFTDGTGSVEVIWFKRINKMRQAYLPGTEYLVFGRPTRFGTRWSIVHPEIERPQAPSQDATEKAEGLRGVYSVPEALRTRGITSKVIHGWITTLLENLRAPLPDFLPEAVVRDNHLLSLDQALRAIHTPRDNDQLQRARERLKFEELFTLQVVMMDLARRRQQDIAGPLFPRVGRFFNDFYSQCLPFPLTGAQKRVIKEIKADMNTGRQMNRLLQGDVGSGKTLVALMTMLLAIDNGTQACLMAPTEILAGQHFQTVSRMAAKIGVNVALLTGSTGRAQRENLHRALLAGTVNILVGTHAVLEEPVQFANLGYVVIDEQHRFGVAQRARLWAKNPSIPPHVLVMTATPIPRTLAMTVYGDLDVSVIDELPPGRHPVTTVLRTDDQRLQVYQGLYKELRKGRQAYIVHPRIEENDKSDLRSLEEGYQDICQAFPEMKVAFVHGQMRPAEKDFQMELFAKHHADILVATTVIEVGVDVPNASVMVIENAERFGLSQLHQLRGRVGRGADQSYCILMTKRKLAKETRQRLELMTQTTDGFLIAEADMRMRGPGDIEGTLQSGVPMDLKIANLATDGQIVQIARDSARALLDSDPSLTLPANAAFEAHLRAQRSATDWSRIS